MQAELHHTRQSLRLLWVIMLWLIVDLVLIATQVVTLMPRPMIAVCILGPVGIAAWRWSRSAQLRAWSDRVDMRVLALPHMLRIGFGSAFLYQVSLGTLPATFGQPAGMGDVLAGCGALCLVVCGVRKRGAWIAWNILGMCDMVMVVTLAQFHIFGGYFDQMGLMFTFPYALAPFIAVPVILMSHLLIGRRLWKRSAFPLIKKAR